MTRECVAVLIDTIEDFLESKGVTITNDEKEGAEGEAIIYGSDYDELEKRLQATLEGSGIYVTTNYYEDYPEPSGEDLTIFVPAMREIIRIEEGTGENLLPEDRADGYVDYINYDRYDAAAIAEDPLDGGMVMYKEYIRDKYSSMIEAVPDILEEVYDNRDLSFIVLDGGRAFPKELFECYEDLTDIKDSMQLDSDTDICRYIDESGKYAVTIDVKGEVRVTWCANGIESGEPVETYHRPSEFPDDLKELIARSNSWWENDPRVYVSENNWFELFIWSHENGDNRYLTSDCVDVEGETPESLKELCKESLRLYLEDVGLADGKEAA